MARRVPFSTTEYPLVSDPIFTGLYCAANCSCSVGACACEPATAAMRTSATEITVLNVCRITKISSSLFCVFTRAPSNARRKVGGSANIRYRRTPALLLGFALTARRRNRLPASLRPPSYRRLPPDLSESSPRSCPVQEAEHLPPSSSCPETSADRPCLASWPVRPCRLSVPPGSGCTFPGDRPRPEGLLCRPRNPTWCWPPLSR